MMKGIATQTVVLIIVAAIVLGLLATLVYTGFEPFRYLSCQTLKNTWCKYPSDRPAWDQFIGDCGDLAAFKDEPTC